MPITSDILPSGIDQADGLGSHPGTADVAGAVIYRPGSTWLEEDDGSPEIERGEQCTFRHTFNCDYANGLVYLASLGRGALLQDDSGNLTRVVTSSLSKQHGGKGRLVVTCECLSFDTPPDEFEVEDVEINPEIQKHPSYATIMGDGNSTLPYNTDVNGSAVDATLWTGAQILQFCQSASDGAGFSGRNESFYQLNSTKITNATVLAAAQALYQRFLKQEATFYMAGFKVVWSQYFWMPPGIDAGGYIQDPVTQGGLPDYFWSTDQTPGGTQIFLTAAITNPIIYTNGVSWLRTADRLSYQRTWFKVTHTWIGGPLGQWDKAIYPLAP